MSSVLDLVTPYRRVCGAILLLLVSVVGPNLRFMTAVADIDAGRIVVPLVLLVVYALLVLLPPVRRVSLTTSWIVLVAVGVAISVGLGFDDEIKRSLAYGVGMFGDAPPWRDPAYQGKTRPFEHPLARYTLRVPDTWQLTPGPMAGTPELIKRERTKESAVLRPSCEVSGRPLAVTVQRLREQSTAWLRVCTRWRGLDACLLKRVVGEGKVQEWEWIGQKPGSSRSIRLQFFLFDKGSEDEINAIIRSVEPAPPGVGSLPCPVPLEWATAFE